MSVRKRGLFPVDKTSKPAKCPCNLADLDLCDGEHCVVEKELKQMNVRVKTGGTIDEMV